MFFMPEVRVLKMKSVGMRPEHGKHACLLTIENEVKTTGNEGKIQVMDVAGLLAIAL
jgi:hypothetical protein